MPLPLRPARIHALEHLRPVLALGAAGAGIDLDIGVVGVGLAGEQSGHLVALGAIRQRRQRVDRFVDQGAIPLGFGHLHQLDRIGELLLDRASRADRLVEPSPLAHHFLRRLGIVPQRLVLDLGVELVEPLHRPVQIEEPAQELEGRPDLVDGGLRFRAHGRNSGGEPPAALGGVRYYMGSWIPAFAGTRPHFRAA